MLRARAVRWASVGVVGVAAAVALARWSLVAAGQTGAAVDADPYDCHLIEYHVPENPGAIATAHLPLQLAMDAECMCRVTSGGGCRGQTDVWMHGKFLRWHANGLPSQVGRFRYNRYDGRWMTWAPDGGFLRGTCWDRALGLWQTFSEAEAATRECPTEPAS